jgi:hypothetical protein
VWGAGVAVLCGYACTVAAGRLTHGFSAYYAAARALATGRLGAWAYDETLFTRYVQDITGTSVLEIFGPNTPSMSLLLVPLAWMSPGRARAVWLLLSLAAWASATARLVRYARARGTRRPSIAIAVMLLSPPVLANIRTGQAYLVVAAAQAAAALCLLDRRDARAGGLLGVALATKSSGLPIILLLAATARGRALIAAVVAGLACVVLTLALSGTDVWLRYPSYAWDFVRQPRATVTAYQTTSGLFRRLCIADPKWNPGAAADCAAVAWTMPVLLTAGAVLVTLGASRRAPAPLWLAAGTCLSLLVLPIAEEHQFVLLALPMMLLLAESAGGPQASIAGWEWTVFGLLLTVPLHYTADRFGSGWAILLAYPRLYATWWLWWLAVRQIARGHRRDLLLAGDHDDRGPERQAARSRPRMSSNAATSAP